MKKSPNPHSNGCGRAYLSASRRFALFLLLVGLAALALSVRLWRSLPPPRISSAAAVPLLASLLWVLAALPAVFSRRGGASTVDDAPLFPKRIIFMLLAISVYCALLALGGNFLLLTFAFLVGTISFLAGKASLRTLLYAAVFAAAAELVFHGALGVVFP